MTTKVGIKGVLFDFDGVLVDSMPIHLQAWHQAYQDIFQSTLKDPELAHLMGRSSPYIAQYLCGLQQRPQLSSKLARHKQSLTVQLAGQVPLLPGSQRFFEELNARAKPFGIVSNAPREFIGTVIQEHDLDAPFFLGFEDYKRPKPHPDPYIMGARQLGLEFPAFRQVLTFEDSTHGLTAAKQAFTIPIGICSFHDPEVLVDAGARQTYGDLQEALDDGILEW
jgi:HAD superfamily hydrolase (TIGR01509 family)